jgi:hypothetical protein
VISFSYWSIKLWFHTEGKLVVVLIIPSSWGFPTGPLRHHQHRHDHPQGVVINLPPQPQQEVSVDLVLADDE